MSRFYVYVIKDSNQDIFYVGMGTNGRASSHLAWSHNAEVNRRVAKASKNGERISVEIVSWHETRTGAADEEKRLIKSFPPGRLANIVHVNKEKRPNVPQGQKRRRKTAILRIRMFPETKAHAVEVARERGISLAELVASTLAQLESHAPEARPQTRARSEA